MVGDLTLAENLVLGIEPTRRTVLDRSAVAEAIAALERASGWALPWDQQAADVGVTDLSRFELLRQLHWGSDILILDEPTAVLGPADTDQLLSTMVRLRDAGCTIVFVTHKLAEVGRVADRVTVLRAGAVVWSGAVADTDASSLARAMVGVDLGDVVPAVRSATGPAALATIGLSVVDARGARRLDDVDITVDGGEIVGVYGVAGSGQRALVEAIMGLVPARRNGGRRRAGCHRRRPGRAPTRRARLHLTGSSQRGTGPRRAAAEQRRRRRAAPATVSRQGIIAMAAWRRRYARVAERFGVRATGPTAAARALSGGNQQRLVVGREIESAPRSSSRPTRRGASTCAASSTSTASCSTSATAAVRCCWCRTSSTRCSPSPIGCWC